MYDITNYISLAYIDDQLAYIRKEIEPEYMFPIILIGNKADLVKERKVSVEDGIKFAKSRGFAGYIECSCKTGENVEEMFQILTRLMLAKSNDFEKYSKP